MSARRETKRFERAALVAGALLVICFPRALQAQSPVQQPTPNLSAAQATGSITVSVKDDQGAPLSVLPSVSIEATARGGPMILSHKEGEEWKFTNLEPGGQYVAKVEAPGFETAQQFVNLPDVNHASVKIRFFLVPSSDRSGLETPAGGAILAPRAQKEVRRGVQDLAAKKFTSAQKHLANALNMAPANPLVNYLVGESWLQAGNTDKATAYLERAVSLDPKQAEALVALGKLRYQQGDMERSIELLNQALASAPKSWEAHWLLAAALLREGNYEQASEHAKSALKYGKKKADPAEVILAVALAKLGQRDKALKILTEYLKQHPHDPRLEQISKVIHELRQSQVQPD